MGVRTLVLFLVTASAAKGDAAAPPSVVQTELVSVAGAASLRLHFAPIELAEGSFIRITSRLDEQVQELDAAALAAWRHSSAYFNGDTLIVEVVGQAPHGSVVKRVESQPQEPQPVEAEGCATCGICGIDDRVPSSELWVARMLPVGCTAVVIDEGGCMASAGHCIAAGMVVQFNVPPSNPDCLVNHPPVEDQFPVTVIDFSNNGIGDDWAILLAGTNNLGQTPFERYGEFRPISAEVAPAGAIVSVTGYGVSCSCAASLTQQTGEGPICEVLPDSTTYQFAADIGGGSAGSGLLLDGEIIGIATHCPCCNHATMVQNPGFAAARRVLCAVACPWDLDGDELVGISDVLTLLAAWGATGVPADLDGGGVGITDLILLLAHWGMCP